MLYARGDLPVTQVSLSVSNKNVIRGFHQLRERPQSKIVQVISGAIIDLFFNPETKEGGYAYLTANDPLHLDISQSCYHAFIAVRKSQVMYFCDTVYDETLEAGFDADTVLPGIMSAGRLVRSEKDHNWKRWE